MIDRSASSAWTRTLAAAGKVLSCRAFSQRLRPVRFYPRQSVTSQFAEFELVPWLLLIGGNLLEIAAWVVGHPMT